MSDWLCISPAEFQAMSHLRGDSCCREGSHVVVDEVFAVPNLMVFFLIFGRNISKRSLSTTCGLKLCPAVLQGQRNFKAFADLSDT